MDTNEKGLPKPYLENIRDSIPEAEDETAPFEPLGADIDVIAAHLEAST